MLKSTKNLLVLLVVLMLLFTATAAYAEGEVNLAPKATVTGSSSFAPEYDVTLAVDGIKKEFAKGEWASLGETEPWIKLEWDNSVTITKIVLNDRENTLDNALGGTMTFSDGSTLEITGIDKLKEDKIVTFDAKTITWLKFEIKGEGANVGLSEIEVWGKEAAASGTKAGSNPKTGDAGMLLYVLAAGAGLAGAGALTVMKKRK